MNKKQRLTALRVCARVTRAGQMEFGGSNSTALPTARESRPTANTLVCREEMSSERRRSPPETYAAQRKSVSADIDGLPGFTISKWRPEMTIGICRFFYLASRRLHHGRRQSAGDYVP
jgi:hypothetical protein